LALEFKLASEIIKTAIVRDIAEIYVLGAIIIIRVILTLVIHWEIKTEMGTDYSVKAIENTDNNE
jgi:uncharacterized membrane protein